MKKMIPYGKQYLDQKDILSVKQSLKEPLITTGKSVKKFENSLSKFLKVKHAIKKNDVVIMPVVNFISAYNMCKSLGAKIFVADVDSQTGQMTPKFLLECIKKNKIKKIKAILTMYMGGFPENITEFYNIKKLFKCLLIEDACHALGSQYMYKNKLLKIGSCSHADISTFSLHPLKPITTGEGGIVTTKNETIASNIRELRSHGIIRDNKFHWKYNIRTPGYNYRLSDINCSLGLSQLKKINSFLIKRKKIYDYYKENLEGFSNSISFPKYNINNKSSYHLVLINVNFNNTKKNKDKFMSYLYKNNIISQYHYIPINKFKVFNSKNLKLKSSNIYYMTTLSIPIYQKLNRNVQNFIIKKIQKFFDNK
jgi:dTDP-4-amino-4,6-dideoxygalactose transaminase